jgi:HemY protein
MLAAPPPKRVTHEAQAEPVVIAPAPSHTPVPAPAPAAQDNAPPVPKEEPVAPADPVKPAPEAAESSPVAETPVFRTRADLGKPVQMPIQTVIPIVRAPDDPGIDDEGPSDEFTEQIGTPKAQAGGWRGFWSRWGA